MKQIKYFVALLFIFFVPVVYAADFGAYVQGEFNAAGQDKTETYGNVIFAPWFSLPFNQSELYISAGIYAGIAQEQSYAESGSSASYIAPELFRLEFSSRVSPLFSFRVGRFNWQDTSGFTAKGRFDGLDLLFSPGNISIGLNALYTGFLFKETAYINNSPKDTKDYTIPFDWADFGNSYFAPGRLISSLYGDFPGLFTDRGALYASVVAQFDLSDAEEKFNTQYLLLRYVFVYKSFDIDLAGAAELENTEEKGIRPAFAYSLEGGWQTPAAFADRLSLGLAWSSGEGAYTGAFFPITREKQSYVLEPILSGIMIIRLNYRARLLPSLSAELGGSYFIRTDETSFSAPYLGEDNYALGMELGMGIQWVPFSDLSFSLKGGIFLPGAGNAWADDAPVLWRITAGMVFSF